MRTERARLIDALASIRGVRPFTSQGNFVLFHVGAAVDQIHLQLISEGIFVKEIGTVLGMKNWLRTTVGTAEMNSRLIEPLREIR